MSRALLVSTIVVAVGASCVPPTEVKAPKPPVVAAPESPTSVGFQVLRGTKQASTSLEINDVEVEPLDDATSWSARVDLADGTNNFTIVAVDGIGQRSDPAVVTVLLDTDAPDAPVLDPAPPSRTQDAALVLTGTMGTAERLVVDGAVVATAGGGDFNVSVPLVVGENLVRLAARDPAGNESEVVELVVTRVVDTDAPDVQITSPQDDDVVGDVFTVSGTVADADLDAGIALAVVACVGACPGGPKSADVDAAGNFTVNVDVATDDPGASDDDLVSVVVTATDEWGNAGTATVTVLRIEGPADAGGTSPSSVKVAALGDAPFAAAVLYVDADGSVHLDVDDGGGFDPNTATIGGGVNPATPSPLALANAAALVAASDGTLHAAWADAAATQVAYRQRAPGKSGALLPSEAVASGFVAESVDAALLTDGTPIVAYIDDAGVVAVQRRTGANQWQAPVVVSDAVTAAAALLDVANVTGVRVTASPGATAAAADDVVTVVWQETSDRDGDAIDDADVVAARFVLGSAAGAPIVLSTSSGGAFIDGESRAPRIAALRGSGAAESGSPVAIAWLDDGGGAGVNGFLLVVDDADFIVPALDEPSALGPAGGAGDDVVDLAVAAAGDAAHAGEISVVLTDATGALALRSGPAAALGARVSLVATGASAPAVARRPTSGGVDVAFVSAASARLLPVEEAP